VGKVQVKKKRKEKKKQLCKMRKKMMWFGIGINKYRKNRWIITQKINNSSQGVRSY
jgi:hypothetical protein